PAGLRLLHPFDTSRLRRLFPGTLSHAPAFDRNRILLQRRPDHRGLGDAVVGLVKIARGHGPAPGGEPARAYLCRRDPVGRLPTRNLGPGPAVMTAMTRC